MREQRYLTVFVACALISLSGLAGCSSEDCKTIDANHPAPSFVGTYVCDQQANTTLCDTYYLCEGQTGIRIASQDVSALVIEKTDCMGAWYSYQGTLCDTNDKSSPKSYSFSANYNVTEPGSDPRVYYSLVGSLLEATTSQKASISGTISLTIISASGTIPNCFLSGHFTGLCDDCQ